MQMQGEVKYDQEISKLWGYFPEVSVVSPSLYRLEMRKAQCQKN